MGRPKKENARSKQIRIRVTPYDWAYMKAASELIGINNTSDLIRKCFWDTMAHYSSCDLMAFDERAEEILKGE